MKKFGSKVGFELTAWTPPPPLDPPLMPSLHYFSEARDQIIYDRSNKMMWLQPIYHENCV